MFNLKFSIFCFSETLPDDNKLENDSTWLQLFESGKKKLLGWKDKCICTRHAVLQKKTSLNKHIVLVDNIKLNMLSFENNKKVQGYVNLIFRYDIIPTMNQSTQVTVNTAIAINHTITNTILDTDFKIGILKSLISDHFAIM